MSKVAAVLFVKNEAEDISWWISWHLSIGISDIIIYDDYSDDGTWEIINLASNVCNVHCLRAIQSDWFNDRQKLTYLDAIERYRENFDWMIFIDADEYINIKKSISVSDFLKQYPEANAIAINWCCYGSNKNVFKPYSPNVFENYKRHSLLDYEYNYIVKSFFRPQHTKTTYINPHRFDVDGKYVTPDHQEVIWQVQHPERTATLPQWDEAQINHYIIRSAEHFIEKVRRRSDIRSSGMGMDLFNYCDKNDTFESYINKKSYLEMYEYNFLIQHEINKKMYYDLKKLRIPLNVNETIIKTEEGKTKKINFYCVKTFHNTMIRKNKITGELIHTDKNSVNSENVICFTIPLFPKLLFIMSYPMCGKLFCHGEARVSSVLTYIIDDYDDTRISLQHPLTKQYLCASIEHGKNEIIINRARVDSWETYVLLNENEISPDSIFIANNIMNSIEDLYSHNQQSNVGQLEIDAIAAFLTSLDTRKLYNLSLNDKLFSFPWLPKQEKLSN